MYKTRERTGALFDAMLRRTLCHELRVILDGFRMVRHPSCLYKLDWNVSNV